MPEETFAGRYRRIGPLGKGAMASVWLAEDTELGRRVAVKLLRPDADRERFRREARAVAALAHPNVCRLYDFGEAAGEGPFMVLEYLSGGSLDDRLRPGVPLPDEETERIARDVADGLAHAHANGLVHRDLKPGNILFDDEGRAKIADFGIVRMTETGAITETGTVLGTAQYISPEQTAGESAGPASDVYSFGVILFQMLTGRLPFESESVIDLVRRHRSEPPPPIGALRAGAPPGLAALALAALAKHPADRPPDGAALAAALAGESAATAILAPLADAEPTAVLRPPRPRARRSVRNVVIAAVIVLLLLGAGVGLALVATDGGSGGVPTVPTSAPTSGVAPPTSTASATTAPASSSRSTTTTGPTTTRETSSERTTTTREATTSPTTTLPTTTVPTTPPTTTEPTTTEPTTTFDTTTAIPTVTT